MNNIEIDIELLITLVEARPALWDKTLDIYKDRNETRRAWKEVCRMLKSDFEELSDTEKYSFSNEVTRRWGNVRDAFVKSNKRLKGQKKSGAASIKGKRYIYSDQLKFLLKLMEERPTEDPLSLNIQIKEEEIHQTSSAAQLGESHRQFEESHTQFRKSHTQFGESHTQQKSRKRRRDDEFEEKLIKALETSNTPPNRHISFFNGIIPSLETLDDDDIIKFQIGVLQLLESIKQSKQTRNICFQQPPTLIQIQSPVAYHTGTPYIVPQQSPGGSKIIQSPIQNQSLSNYTPYKSVPPSPSHYSDSASPALSSSTNTNDTIE